jgi:hypothetical protein
VQRYDPYHEAFGFFLFLGYNLTEAGGAVTPLAAQECSAMLDSFTGLMHIFQGSTAPQIGLYTITLLEYLLEYMWCINDKTVHLLS